MNAPRYETIPSSLGNRGPWMTLEHETWAGFSLGQTTAVGPREAGFEEPRLRMELASHLPGDRFFETQQVHGNRVVVVGPQSVSYGEADGLVSPRAGNVLTLRTADCLPVYIRNRSSTRYALLHAGWRGLAAGIVPRTLQRFFDEPVDLVVGAGIGVEDYEVGPEVLQVVADWFDVSPGELENRGMARTSGHLDLHEVLRQQLPKSPATRSLRRVEHTTGSSDESVPTWSYRRDRTDHRMLHWIVRDDSR